MAYLDDNFQGYAIGATLPLGSWTGGGFFAGIAAEPAGTGIPGTDRALGLFLASATYDRTTIAGVSSFSQWASSKHDASGNAEMLFTFSNGPNGLGQSFDLLQIRVEPDGTISAVSGTGAVLGNSFDDLYRFYTYNFFQFNLTFTDVLVAGVLRVHILAEIVMNGKVIITFNTTTGVAVASLANATSEINKFVLNSGNYGAYTLDVLTPANTYPHPGTPNMIGYQSVVEVDQLLDSGVLVATQAATEVEILPDTAKLTIYQMVVEVDVLLSGARRHPEYIHRRHFPGD